MFSTDDTIVAIATPPGRGGIGVVRISGNDTDRIGRALTGRDAPLQPRHATFVRLRGEDGAFDQAVVTFFPGPHSYTGENVLEISAHGSPVLLRAIVEAAMREGARLAEPGEFTLRAYLAGRLDLVQAEAVRDLVDAVTPLQARAAFDQLEGTLTHAIRDADAQLFDLCARLEASLDFPDEGYHFVGAAGAAAEIEAISRTLDALLATADRGRLIREGAQVAIVGPPNSGKSSLFNYLAGAGRAIVTDVPGTTRDLLTEVVDIDGIPITLVDTAGVRTRPSDAIEAEGIARATHARSIAALTLLVLDRSRELSADDRALVSAPDRARVVVANKSDLPAAWCVGEDVLEISVLTGAGLDALRERLIAALSRQESYRDAPAITNVRHAALVERARDALR
ncbi:MAG TPA: tRNA uridine-5-carboxymethylaminomethyl(34) synthesis GTPase MnmE, partial [Vicinamibacterales bacterium]|nr:tRNA uridine-5-carboxymethylaminomethyl(34) synthesis GTPase MnmE [Vicinamibacterales bacterium]